MCLEALRLGGEYRLQMRQATGYIACFDHCPPQHQLCHGEGRILVDGLLGVGERRNIVATQAVGPGQHGVGGRAGGRDGQFVVELSDRLIGIGGEEEVSVEIVKIGRRGEALEDGEKGLVRGWEVAAHDVAGGMANHGEHLGLGWIDVLGEDGHPHAGEADAGEHVVVDGAVLDHEGVLTEGLLEAPGMGEKERLVVEKNACILGLVCCTKGDTLLQIAEGFGIVAFFELGKAAEGKGGASVRGQLNVVGEGIDCRPIGIGCVLEGAEIPPAVGRLGVELDCLLIEADCAREIALSAGGGRGRRDLVEGGGEILSL